MSEAPTARRPRTRGRALPWLVAGLLLATVGIPSVAAFGKLPAAPEVGVARPLASNVSLAVNLTDSPSFSPRYLKAPEGTNVSIHLDNVGNYTHTFTLSAKPDVTLAPTLTPAEVYGFFRTNGSLANVSLAPGAAGWANVSFNTTDGGDSFEFVSVVPYQFQAGMSGLLNITLVGPGLLLSENTTNTPGFSPNVLAAAPSHYPIALDVFVTNLGDLSHTFTLASQSNVTLSSGNFTTYFMAHPPLVSVNVPASPGGTVWANFTLSAPGVFEYICEIPGHFAAGMFGLLYVGVPLPAVAPPPSTAIVEVWVLLGSAILLGVGLALAVIASLTGRFPRRPGSHGGHGHP